MRVIGRLTELRLCGRLNCGNERLICSMSDSRAAGLPLSQVLQFLTSFAPLTLAESWDNVGLLVEPVSPVPVKKVLLTIDLTEAVMREAVDLETNLIIAYHPPIFQPIKRITNGKWKERLLATCLQEKIAVYSPHTTWDAVKGGLSDWLASPFDFKEVAPLVPSAGELLHKGFSHHVTVFCPPSHDSKCQEAIKQSRSQLVSRTQLETMVKYKLMAESRRLEELEDGLNQTDCHYSAYERSPVPPEGCGSGRIGTLKAPVKMSDVISKVKALVGLSHVRVAVQQDKTLDSTVSSVAVVAGSGASLLRGVRADLYVTGEMLHHDLLEATHCGASVLLINHSDSERGYLMHFASLLTQHFGDTLCVKRASSDCDPLITV